MPCPGTGPCQSWDLDLSCCLTPSGTLPDPCLLDGVPVPQAIIDQSKLAASQLLWAMTGRRYGCCQVTIRPLCFEKCPDACGGLFTNDGWSPDAGFPWTPLHLPSGDWTNISCTQGNCTCVQLCEIQLPYPVCSVDRVKIDGVVLGASTYAVTDFNTLVKTTGLPQAHLLAGATGPVGGPLVAGPVTVTGTGATPITDLAGNSGVSTSIVGAQYRVNIGTFPSTLKTDPIIKLVFPLSGGTITIDAPNNGRFEAFSISGGASIAQVGTTLTVGSSQQSYASNIVGIRMRDPQGDGVAKFADLFYTVVAGTAFAPIILTDVQWTVTGTSCWPDCNNLTLPDTEVGTWSVTVTYGTPIPELVKMAAAEMACELIHGCVGKPCRLPQRMSSVTRQGVTVSFLDDMQFLDKGLTGLYLVDLAARTYNPHQLMRRPVVWSPDVDNKWRVQSWRSGDSIGPNCT